MAGIFHPSPSQPRKPGTIYKGGFFLRILILKDYAQLSRTAANFVSAQLILKPDSVLGLATGSTPEGMYAELVRLHREEGLDFSKACSFNLDEYLGLSPEHPQSYHNYMDRHLFSKVNLPADKRHLPKTQGEDPEESCACYDRSIATAGGIDLQVLGIGVNGHIGFNEPDEQFTPQTHIVTLDESTISANARFFSSPEEVPKQALTLGIKNILGARRIIILAGGASKAEAVFRAIRGPILPALPASILQLHDEVIWILDEEAARLLH